MPEPSGSNLLLLWTADCHVLPLYQCCGRQLGLSNLTHSRLRRTNTNRQRELTSPFCLECTYNVSASCCCLLGMHGRNITLLLQYLTELASCILEASEGEPDERGGEYVDCCRYARREAKSSLVSWADVTKQRIHTQIKVIRYRFGPETRQILAILMRICFAASSSLTFPH